MDISEPLSSHLDKNLSILQYPKEWPGQYFQFVVQIHIPVYKFLSICLIHIEIYLSFLRCFSIQDKGRSQVAALSSMPLDSSGASEKYLQNPYLRIFSMPLCWFLQSTGTLERGTAFSQNQTSLTHGVHSKSKSELVNGDSQIGSWR